MAELVGIEEGFLACAVRGRTPTRTEQQQRSLAVHRRFFASLALQDLVHEVPLNAVARRYGANRGMLQSLQGSAATFAGMVTVFCEKLGWTNIALLLSQFQSRLSFGVERELCDLVRISLLNAARARMLYNAGYHTVASVATAPPSEIENILHNAAPFVSSRRRGEETETEVRERSEARVFWVAGRRGLTEGAAAKLIVSEAQKLLQSDVAQLGIHWKPPEATDNLVERVYQGEVNVSGSKEVCPKFTGVKSGSVAQSKSRTKKLDSTRPVIEKIPKTNDAVLRVNSSDRPQQRAYDETVESSQVRLNCQESGPRSRKDEVANKVFVDFLKPARFVNIGPLKIHGKGRIDSEKTENTSSLVHACSEVLASSKDPEPVVAVSCTSTSKTPLCGGGTVLPRLRSKRRSPIPEIPEPQEKLQKKETTVTKIPKVILTEGIHAEQSRKGFSALEVSGDCKVCSDDKSVSLELYSEPLEGEEPAVKQNPGNAHNSDTDIVSDSQALTCSLSDTCLMECDAMVEERSVKSYPLDMKLSQDLIPAKRECEVVCDEISNALTDQTDSLAELKSQDVIGEYDIPLRHSLSGEFDAERSPEMLSSLASRALKSPECSVADARSSTGAASSFSLRLSASDGCLDSDLSTLAIAELMAKEAEGKELRKHAETCALQHLPQVQQNGSYFTKIKNSECTDSSFGGDQKSPAKKISPYELLAAGETEGNETADYEVIPSTPPREQMPSQDNFKTKTSATPLSTRKRPSPRRTPYSSTPDEGLVIIDVTGHEQVFAMFLKEWRSQTRFSLAVACERSLDKNPKIGARFSNAQTSRGLIIEGEDKSVVGVAVSWGDKDAYYISFLEHAQSSRNRVDDSQAESAVDYNLTLSRRVNEVKSTIKLLTERGSSMVCFNVKEHFKVRMDI